MSSSAFASAAALVVILASVAATIDPPAGAAADRLPRLTAADAVRDAKRTIRARFDFFRFSHAKRVECDVRLSRVKRRCSVRWTFGDVSYRGHVVVRHLRCRAGACWSGRLRVRALDEFCHYVMGLPRDQCTTPMEGAVRRPL